MHVMITANAAWNVWHFRRSLVEALIADGRRVTVLAAPDQSVSKLIGLGVTFQPLRINKTGLGPIQNILLIRQFRKSFRKHCPDIILSFTIKNNIFGSFAAKMCGIQFVPNVTGLGTAFLYNKIVRKSAEALYRNAFYDLPVVFFQNQDDQELFIDLRLVNPHQCRMLPGSGIDLEFYKPIVTPESNDKVVFLMIARLLYDKGVSEFVEAARIVKGCAPQTRFQLLGAVGSENRTAVNASTVRQWVDEGIIDYLGTKADVRPAISAASCVVLPSYREGAPRTLIEGAAMARPLITTDVPGCRAVVDRDVTGFLCKVRSTQSLVSAMRRFLALDSKTRNAMGRAGRAKMEREFDQVIVLSAYREVLAELTQSGKQGG